MYWNVFAVSKIIKLCLIRCIAIVHWWAIFSHQIMPKSQICQMNNRPHPHPERQKSIHIDGWLLCYSFCTIIHARRWRICPFATWGKSEMLSSHPLEKKFVPPPWEKSLRDWVTGKSGVNREPKSALTKKSAGPPNITNIGYNTAIPKYYIVATVFFCFRQLWIVGTM